MLLTYVQLVATNSTLATNFEQLPYNPIIKKVLG